MVGSWNHTELVDRAAQRTLLVKSIIGLIALRPRAIGFMKKGLPGIGGCKDRGTARLQTLRMGQKFYDPQAMPSRGTVIIHSACSMSSQNFMLPQQPKLQHVQQASPIGRPSLAEAHRTHSTCEDQGRIPAAKHIWI